MLKKMKTQAQGTTEQQASSDGGQGTMEQQASPAECFYPFGIALLMLQRWGAQVKGATARQAASGQCLRLSLEVLQMLVRRKTEAHQVILLAGRAQTTQGMGARGQ